jgi:dTDP-glucose 4,6-dehydratase
MTRVLLTGAGGAIGVHMIAHLMHNTDWEVVALDSFNRDHKGEFDRITRVCRDHPQWPARIKVFAHDLRAPFSMREVQAIGQIDHIINLASRSDVQASIDDPADFCRNNHEMMLTMLEYARATMQLYGLKTFLHFSTDEVYGPAEANGLGHPEWDPILPSNPYSASKAAQEALAIAWWRSYGLPLIITNTMNNFGEMQAPSKFPAMIQKKIESGEEIEVHTAGDGQVGTRYYLHSRNAADGVLFILQNVEPHLHSPGEIDRPLRLNIVGDRQVSNEELVVIISKLMGKKATWKRKNFHDHNPGHDLHYGLDGTRLARLGWKAPIDFETSLKNTIEWQQRNAEWMK